MNKKIERLEKKDFPFREPMEGEETFVEKGRKKFWNEQFKHFLIFLLYYVPFFIGSIVLSILMPNWITILFAAIFTVITIYILIRIKQSKKIPASICRAKVESKKDGYDNETKHQWYELTVSPQENTILEIGEGCAFSVHKEAYQKTEIGDKAYVLRFGKKNIYLVLEQI